MINLENIYVVEFSLSQKAFHRCTFQESVENNIKSVYSRKQNDYQIIYVCNSICECDNFINSISEKTKDYTMFRTINGETIVL